MFELEEILKNYLFQCTSFIDEEIETLRSELIYPSPRHPLVADLGLESRLFWVSAYHCLVLFSKC